MRQIATIPNTVTRGEELIVVPRSLYEQFSWMAKETEDALEKVRRGKQALKRKKTFALNSPKELLDQNKR